jgi:ABC-type transporter Mla maintaining outer membrane lipid asymmetry permease subunit MlaE
MLPLWRSPAWGLRFAAHYLRLAAGPTAWIYIAIAGAIAGFVSTYFTFRYLPYRRFTELLFIENLLAAIGFAQYRVLVPLLVTILVAARSGAAVASDVGGKSYGRQIDALRTLGAPPARYLGTGILYAFLLGTPLLNAIGFLAARGASLVVYTGTHGDPFFWETYYHRDLAVAGQWWWRGTGWLAAKVLVCAAGTAAISYLRSARPMHSPADVSRCVTSTILWSTLWVLVTHFAFAFFEFEGGMPEYGGP